MNTGNREPATGLVSSCIMKETSEIGNGDARANASVYVLTRYGQWLV